LVQTSDSELEAGCDKPAVGNGEYKAVYITSAANPFKCLFLYGKPAMGEVLQVWDCPMDKKLVTKFLIPTGSDGKGYIRPLAAMHLCLDAPEGAKIQLWPCADVLRRNASDHISFQVTPEAPAWLRYRHFDLPDEQDAENITAKDLWAVMRHVEQRGFAGFSLYRGRAWIKGVTALSLADLHYMGPNSHVIFYLRRPSGDFTIRLTSDAGLCMGTPGHRPKPGSSVHLFKCERTERREATRFKIHEAPLDEAEQQQLYGKPRGPCQTAVQAPAQQPQPPQAPEGAVVMDSMTLKNINYARLSSDERLMGSMVGVIKNGLAEAAGNGVTADSIMLNLSPGSVQVDSAIHLPPGVSKDSVLGNLGSAGTVRDAIADEVSQLPGMSEVSTGRISAQHNFTQARESPLAGLARVLSWIALGIVACIAATCCCTVLHHERARLASLTSKLRPTGGAKAPTLTQYKTRTETTNIDSPGVWRLGRIADRTRPDQTPYDVDLDSTGRRPATLALAYNPVNGQARNATLPR